MHEACGSRHSASRLHRVTVGSAAAACSAEQVKVSVEMLLQEARMPDMAVASRNDANWNEARFGTLLVRVSEALDTSDVAWFIIRCASLLTAAIFASIFLR